MPARPQAALRRREAARKYYQAHRQELRKKHLAYFYAHRDHMNEANRGWRIAHHEYDISRARKSRADLNPGYLRDLIGLSEKQLAALPPETAEALLNAKKESIHAKRTIRKTRVQPA